MANITPYRQNSIEVKQELKPRYGLIRAPKPTPPHDCRNKRPKASLMVDGAVFRCKCDKVYFTKTNYQRSWFETDMEHWKSVGGKEKKYGLIKPHTCKLPGGWYRFWSWCCFRPVYYDSLYRCHKCKDVFEWNGVEWHKAHEEKWKKLGGE